MHMHNMPRVRFVGVAKGQDAVAPQNRILKILSRLCIALLGGSLLVLFCNRVTIPSSPTHRHSSTTMGQDCRRVLAGVDVWHHEGATCGINKNKNARYLPRSMYFPS